MKFRVPVFVSHLSAITLGVTLCLTSMAHADEDKVFNRIATFPVYLNTDVETESVAEIVDVSKDGKTLVYTDSENESLGFVDIKKPKSPQPLGIIDVGGEPTSVAVAGDYALVAVDTSPDFVSPSGHLHVIEISTQAIVATHTLAGQPDSVAVSPNGQYAAVVIENQRNEEWCVVLGNGLLNDFPVPEDDEIAEAACDNAGGEVAGLPQLPSGLLQIVDLVGAPGDWRLRNVSLDGVTDKVPTDAEPEYVDINKKNIAVVTMQENNHIALVDLVSGSIINDFPANVVDLDQIDIKEEDPALISLTDSKVAIPSEPDGVSWISNKVFVTADEGDMDGGSRGITAYDTNGNVVFNSGNELEHEVVRLGHYPDDRSKNKGNEPENADFGNYNGEKYVLVASERSSVIFVYKVKGEKNKFKLVQTLPAGYRPEGIKTIPKRGLAVAASEKDDRGNKYRGTLTIYKLQDKDTTYPTIVSADRVDGTPIPWGALSGFATDPNEDDSVYTIHDSFYQQSRIYKMDIDEEPAVITDEIVLKDGGATVNLDPEGIAVSARGDSSFWVASEGRGSVDDPNRPVESNSVVVHAATDGTILETVSLPASVNGKQRRFGFEGVASVMEGGNEILYVAFQRAWVGDPAPNNVDDGGKVRIGRYDTSTGDWTFAYYPLDVRESPNKGWVGLSEITALGDGEFAILERDNQANTDARIKRVYKIDISSVTFKADGMAFDTLDKSLVRDLMPDLEAVNGMVLEKIESLAVTEDGDVLIANDNDGIDDSNGETQLIWIEDVFED